MLQRNVVLKVSVTLALCAGLHGASAAERAAWDSLNQFRVILSVEGPTKKRSNSPAAVEIDFQKWLGARGGFDENSVEVIPVGRKERVAHRVDRLWGASVVRLNFVLPDETCREAAVYFDVAHSKHARRVKYGGLVGDGDRFCQEFGRREIGPSHFDCFADFDGDGDLDLFKGGVEPFVYCYENV